MPLMLNASMEAAGGKKKKLVKRVGVKAHHSLTKERDTTCVQSLSGISSLHV